MQAEGKSDPRLARPQQRSVCYAEATQRQVIGETMKHRLQDPSLAQSLFAVKFAIVYVCMFFPKDTLQNVQIAGSTIPNPPQSCPLGLRSLEVDPLLLPFRTGKPIWGCKLQSDCTLG